MINGGAGRSIGIVFACFIATITLARSAAGHDSSGTKVHVSIASDSVRATFEPSAADILYFVLNEPTRHEFLDNAEALAATPRVARYVQQHAELRAGAKILRAEVPNPNASPATIEWHTASDARQATLSIDLFNDPGFSAVFEITFDHAGAWDPRREYLRPGETIAFDLPGATTRPSTTNAAAADAASIPPPSWLGRQPWGIRYVAAPALLLVACVGLLWTAKRVFVS